MPRRGRRVQGFKCLCGKRFYSTERASRQAHDYIAKVAGGKQEPVRFYQCTFKAWHWTRKLVNEKEQDEC